MLLLRVQLITPQPKTQKIYLKKLRRMNRQKVYKTQTNIDTAWSSVIKQCFKQTRMQFLNNKIFLSSCQTIRGTTQEQLKNVYCHLLVTLGNHNN